MYIRSYTIFSTLHPALLLFYALGAPVLAMAGMQPVFLAAEFLCAVSVHWFYLGMRSTVDGIKGIAVCIVAVTVLNMLTNPMGVTELFKFGSRLFTLESLCYGLTAGMMLGTMFLWFRCFTAILPNDKFLYLFGGKFQTTALLLSMILKLFPETRYKIRCISLAEDVDTCNEKEPVKIRLRRSMRQISSLLEWSMEDGIETAEAMKARGYGQQKRGCYQIYRFTRFDAGTGCYMVLVYIASAAALFTQSGKFVYYPALAWNIEHPVQAAAGLLLIIIFLLTPVWLELFRKGGKRRWV